MNGQTKERRNVNERRWATPQARAWDVRGRVDHRCGRAVQRVIKMARNKGACGSPPSRKHEEGWIEEQAGHGKDDVESQVGETTKHIMLEEATEKRRTTRLVRRSCRNKT